ncbi:MAG: GNAT family N-acetyltransferase [Treponema sp.]
MIYAIDITKKNISRAIDFCLPYEEYSVNLVSFLKQEENRFFSNLKDTKMFLLDERIIGVASINSHGFFIYCFNFYGVAINDEEIYKTIVSTFNFNLIYAIMGEAKFQEQLLDFLSRKSNINTKIIITYILMTRLKEAKITTYLQLTEELKIIRANIKNANILLDLQIEYEKEEVYQDKKEFPRYISLMNLESILKNEILYFATIGKFPIAKANTNAQGVNYAQIGGVYTLSEYRRHGIASCVVDTLIKHINVKNKKNVCLFVKETNIKAISMYKKLGLKEKGRFFISYFR